MLATILSNHIQTPTFILDIMAGPLPVAHAHAFFLAVVLLVAFPKSTPRRTLVCTAIAYLSWRSVQILIALRLHLSHVERLVGFLVIIIVVLVDLSNFVLETIGLLKSLISRVSIRRHLPASARKHINHPLLLLVGFPCPSSALISSSVAVKVSVISAAFVCLPKFEVWITSFRVNFIASILESHRYKIRSPICSHLIVDRLQDPRRVGRLSLILFWLCCLNLLLRYQVSELLRLLVSSFEPLSEFVDLLLVLSTCLLHLPPECEQLLISAL